MDALTFVSFLVSTSLSIIALVISVLTFRRYSRVRVRVRAPLVLGLADMGEMSPFMRLASFPFSSLGDGIEHLEWIPIEIHNESQSKSISVNLVWIEIFDNPLDESFRRLSEGRESLLRTKPLKVLIKEHLPISLKAGSHKIVHISIRTAAEIWEKHIHKIGVLKVRHSFGTAKTDPLPLDLLWEYYSYVAQFVSREVLRQEVDSLKHSKMNPDKLVGYATSLYNRLGFVPQLGLVQLSWILKEKTATDSFFKLYSTKTDASLRSFADFQESFFRAAIQEGKVSPPKKGERIPICIVNKAVPKNIESALELAKEFRDKVKSDHGSV